MDFEKINYAAAVIRGGGIIAYPTESCFGLGCDPRNLVAVKKLLQLKRRPRAKGLILIADRFLRFSGYLEELSHDSQDKIRESWPGPVTWLCPARAGTSKWLIGDHNTLGVRVTAFPVAANLSRQATMAIVSTSANIAQQDPIRSARRVEHYFGDMVDYILDLPIGPKLSPSTIKHVITNDIIRT